MKKFITELENRGIIGNLIKATYSANDMTGKNAPAPKKVVDTILKLKMVKSDDLADLFIEESSEMLFDAVYAHFKKRFQEAEATDALKDVDPDALFAKATGADKQSEKGASGLKKENEEAIEDALVSGFLDFIEALADAFGLDK